MSSRSIFQPTLTLILMALMVWTSPVNAQTVNEITSELEVSGSSQMYAGAIGVAPVDIDGQSRILIAWHKAPVPGGGFGSRGAITPPLDFQTGVFVSTYSQTGVTLREAIRVDEPDSKNWPMGAILAADAQGRFVVVWRQARYYDEDKASLLYSIWMRPFDAEGLPLTEAQRLAYETDALPSIDMAPNGEFVIVLGRTKPANESNFDREAPQFWSYDANFQATHDAPYLVDTSLSTPPYSLISAVSLNENGDLALAYIDSTIFAFTRNRYLRLRTLTSDGQAISLPIEVESSTVWGLDIEWLDDNNFVASWMDGGRNAPVTGKWQVFDKNGQSVSQLFSTELAVGQGGIVKISESEFAVAWATESGPILIPSTLDMKMQEIPLNIHNEFLPGSFIDYSVGDFSGWPVGYPLVVTSVIEGQFAAVWMNKIDHREQVRAEVFKLKAEDNEALFESEVVGPCVEDRTATVRLSWSSSVDHIEIYVAEPPSNKLFARVRGSGEIHTGLWARHGMVFQLVDLETSNILATVKATPSPNTCPLSPMLTDLDVIEVCDPHELSVTEVLWDITSTSLNSVEVRVNAIDGKLFARGGQLGSAFTGDWLRNNTVFYLLEPYTTTLLGTASSEYKQVACPPENDKQRASMR